MTRTSPAEFAGTGQTASVLLRPRWEGANIRTWLGFKHFVYLAEEAVLGWFRERGFGPGRLYHEHGLGLTVLESSVLLPAVLEVDDEVVAEVTAQATPGRFAVKLRTVRASGETVVLRGKLTVALVPQPDAPAAEPVPGELAPLVTDSFPAAPEDPPPGVFAWTWRVPYFYCQYSDQLAHSGYVRALEEVVDRFLDDRGLAVPKLLAERGWIPVVSRAAVRLHAPARMDERVRTTFAVQDVLKGVMYDATMHCAVERDGRWITTATGRILHGYAISRGPDAGTLAELDEATVAALNPAGSR